MLVEKCKNKKRKLYHTANFFHDFYYNDFKKYTLCKDSTLYSGWIYELDKPDTGKLKNVYEKYHNTYIVKTYCQYAPEIKKTWLFIAG